MPQYNHSSESHTSSQWWILAFRLFNMLHIFLLMLFSMFLEASHLSDVTITRGKFTLATNDGFSDFCWEIILFGKRKGRVREGYCTYKGHELLSEMVWSFFGHFGWEVVHWVEENGVLCGLGHLVEEGLWEGVVQEEGVLDGGEAGGELDGAHVVSWDITYS